MSTYEIQKGLSDAQHRFNEANAALTKALLEQRPESEIEELYIKIEVAQIDINTFREQLTTHTQSAPSVPSAPSAPSAALQHTVSLFEQEAMEEENEEDEEFPEDDSE